MNVGAGSYQILAYVNESIRCIQQRLNIIPSLPVSEGGLIKMAANFS